MKLRLRVRDLLILVATGALLCLLAVEAWDAWSPYRRWMRALRDDNLTARSLAATNRPKWISDDRAVGEFVVLLGDRDPGLRWTAAAYLAELGPKAEQAVPQLIVATRDHDPQVRMHAILALSWVVEPCSVGRDHAIQALVAALHDENPDVQMNAAASLIRLGEGEAALPFVIERLGVRQGRPWAYWTLGRMGRMAEAALPELREALHEDFAADHSNDPGRRQDRAKGAALLLRLGDAETAIPYLRLAETDEDEFVRRVAVEALADRDDSAE